MTQEAATPHNTTAQPPTPIEKLRAYDFAMEGMCDALIAAEYIVDKSNAEDTNIMRQIRNAIDGAGLLLLSMLQRQGLVTVVVTTTEDAKARVARAVTEANTVAKASAELATAEAQGNG